MQLTLQARCRGFTDTFEVKITGKPRLRMVKAIVNHTFSWP